MRGTYRTSVLVLLMAVMLQAPDASAQGLVKDGREIAERWCAACHAVSDTQAAASADIPSFDAIAAKYADAMGAFEALLADPHPDMPQMALSRQDIRNLMAYLRSRRP